MKRLWLVTVATLVLRATAATLGAEKGDSPIFGPTLRVAARKSGQSPQTPEILKVVNSFQAAFNSGDAQALAALFTPTGDYIGPQGERVEGRDELAKRFAAFLAAHKELRLQITVTSVSLSGEDLAVVDAVPKVTPTLPGVPAEPRATLVVVKRDGRWLIQSARDALNYVPSNYKNLQEIEWLLGDWANDTASPEVASVRATCDWTTNKSFLIRKFTVALKEGVALAGTEVIGWDPREHKIRSWDFDSNGGFGQSVWSREDNRWIIQRAGLRPDGSLMSATHILTRVDDNTLIVQSRDRLENGERLPDLGEVIVKRQPAQPQAAPAILPQGKPAENKILP